LRTGLDELFAYFGMFPSSVTKTGPDGKPVTTIEPVSAGSDIQSIFFDMLRHRRGVQKAKAEAIRAQWEAEHPDGRPF